MTIPRIPRCVAALGVLAVGGGCALEFTEPGAARPPRLFVSVYYDEVGVTGYAGVGAFLDPGTDLAGQANPVAEGVLRVLGLTLRPRSFSELGTAFYDTSWTFNPDSFGGAVVDLEAPAVDGYDESPRLYVVAASRSGPARVDVVQGADVRLETRAPELTGPGPSLEGWNLQVTRDTVLIGSFNVRGPVPQPLVIPAGWLAGVGPGACRLTLAVSQSENGASANGYEAELHVRSTMRWTLNIVAPP